MANIKKLQRTAVIFLILVYAVATLIWGIGTIKDNKAEKAAAANIERIVSMLDTAAASAPSGITVGTVLAVTAYKNAEGNAVNLKDYANQKLTLLFWNSTNEDCQALLTHVSDLQDACKDADTELILVNKLDGTEETVDTAKAYLAEIKYDGTAWFDNELTAYKALGIKKVPTTIILNGEGKVVLALGGAIANVDNFKALLEYADNQK